MKTILIYDPDPDLLEIMCLALEMAGFSVTGLLELNDGIIRSIGQTGADLLLLDLAHAGRRCIEKCRQIKHTYPGLPVIALSCNNDISETYDGYGFDDCIAKPFDLEHFYSTVKRYTAMAFSGSGFSKQGNRLAG